MRNDREWLVPLTGVLFILLVIVSFAIGGEPPDADDPVAEIVEHYVDNKDSVMIAAVLGTLAGAALIFFFGYLRKVLRAAEGPDGMLSLVAFIGSVILATGVAIDGTISFALAETADDLEPSGVQTLQALWDNDFLPLALGSMVMLLAAGISIVRHGALPKWLGWVAIVLAVLGPTPAGFFAFLGGAVWILIVSIMLTMRARSGPVAPPPAATDRPGAAL